MGDPGRRSVVVPALWDDEREVREPTVLAEARQLRWRQRRRDVWLRRVRRQRQLRPCQLVMAELRRVSFSERLQQHREESAYRAGIRSLPHRQTVVDQ